MRLGDVILEMNAALLLKKQGGTVPLIVLHSALAQRKGEATSNANVSVIIHNTFAFDVATVIFLRASRSNQRVVSGSQRHRGENIESMLLPALESRVSVWCCDTGWEWEKKKDVYEETVTLSFKPSPSFIFLTPFLSFCLSLLSLFTAYCCHCLI